MNATLTAYLNPPIEFYFTKYSVIYLLCCIVIISVIFQIVNETVAGALL